MSGNNMNIDKEKLFVDRYIIKNRRERILYELSKPSKRLDALSRFCHTYYMNVDERKIIYRGRDAGNDKLKEIVETYSNETEGYMMCWDERYDCKNMTLEYALK